MATISSPSACVHDGFLLILPNVQRHAQFAFRGLDPVAREEAVAEAVAAAFVAYASLRQRGKEPHRFCRQLAIFAVLRVRGHRQVGGRAGSREVLSWKVQRRHGFQVESLHHCGRTPHDEWHEAVVDNTQTPVPDQASFRLAFPKFLASLSQRDRRIVRFLAKGHSAKEAAAKFGVSGARITQLRQRWCREWLALHDELPSTEQTSQSLLSMAV